MCMKYYNLDVYIYPIEIFDLNCLVHINVSLLHTVQSSPPQICSETFECKVCLNFKGLHTLVLLTSSRD